MSYLAVHMSSGRGKGSEGRHVSLLRELAMAAARMAGCALICGTAFLTVCGIVEACGLVGEAHYTDSLRAGFLALQSGAIVGWFLGMALSVWRWYLRTYPSVESQEEVW